MILHKHLLVNAKVNTPLDNEGAGIAFLSELVKRIDMKIIKGPFASYVEAEGNRGLTGVVMIETSHIAFHIWDEPQPAHLQFDLYTCGTLNKDSVLEFIKQIFDVQSLDYVLFDREEGFVIEAQGSI